jgi:hypothetical protein
MNLRESFGACLIPEEKPQSDDELDTHFEHFPSFWLTKIALLYCVLLLKDAGLCV